MGDEESRALAVKTVAAVFMPIATISVMLRCYVRGWIVKGFGWDDASMVVAAVYHLFLLEIRQRQANDLDVLCDVRRLYDWRHSIWYWLSFCKPRTSQPRDGHGGTQFII